MRLLSGPYQPLKIKSTNENKGMDRASPYACSQLGFRLHLMRVEHENVTVETGTAEKRRCNRCDLELPYTPEHWPATHGKAVGEVCRLCSRNRKRDFDRKYRQMRVAARTQSLASLADTPTPPASAGGVPHSRDAKPGELPVKQLEVARALRVGAAKLNEAAEGILATILEYASNSQSPHHEWALRLVAERVIPKKLYEDLGGQAAGIKAGQGTARPAVTIIVQPATPAAVVHPIVVEGESERVI